MAQPNLNSFSFALKIDAQIISTLELQSHRNRKLIQDFFLLILLYYILLPKMF